jgi:hypothetical protein
MTNLSQFGKYDYISTFYVTIMKYLILRTLLRKKVLFSVLEMDIGLAVMRASC